MLLNSFSKYFHFFKKDNMQCRTFNLLTSLGYILVKYKIKWITDLL